jgi:hypothetical protein
MNREKRTETSRVDRRPEPRGRHYLKQEHITWRTQTQHEHRGVCMSRNAGKHQGDGTGLGGGGADLETPEPGPGSHAHQQVTRTTTRQGARRRCTRRHRTEEDDRRDAVQGRIRTAASWKGAGSRWPWRALDRTDAAARACRRGQRTCEPEQRAPRAHGEKHRPGLGRGEALG